MISIIEGFVGVNGTDVTKTLFTFHGSSEESKPTGTTVADGSIYWETDTGNFYRYDAANTTWRLS